MTRKTITLTEDDAAKLERLAKRHDISSSKIVRIALRKFYEEAATRSLERAYKEYYAKDRRRQREAIEDFTAAGIDTW